MTDTTEAAWSRGRTLLDLGRAVEAEAQLRAALATDPGNSAVLADLGRALVTQSRWDDARSVAQSALTADPHNLSALLVLSQAQRATGALHEALTTVRSALRAAPEVAALHLQEGAILLEDDRPQEALSSLERARRLAPEDPDVLVCAAAALAELNRHDEAVATVRAALSLDPENETAHAVLGQLTLRRGGGRDAVDAYRTAVRLDPVDETNREGLALALKSRNPLYGQLLRYSGWLDGLPAAARWGILLAPLFLTRLLEPFDHQTWARVVIGLVIVLVALTWTLEPLMNTVLLCGRRSRALLPRTTRLTTVAFLVFLALGVGCAVAQAVEGQGSYAFATVGCALWAFAAGSAHLVAPRRQRVAIALVGAGALLAVVAVATLASPVLVVLFLTGGAMLWFVRLA
ncbi:tetratricopeptide repeat protein [Luteipulveratus flavus]|uniref:Tetratricopeptide repeat protein n=1 Tax=Luteipulveratus flavus TaxID=3031728 RepID=A0ABT6C8U8_9MICO|nr:tetratricopeptide repeat protein [Luteipulveratus sp. YIM 133296]MDF8264459.1 tetratricopeptide repeat protein [Luteipulveratus sp. YIM 133296]